MRIAQIATVVSPVRPDHAGSVETIIWLLSRELARAGHDVTVFGCAGGEVAPGVRFIPTLPGPYGDPALPHEWMLCEWMNLAYAMAHSREFDLIHSHVYLWGIPLQSISAAPLVHTLHILPYDDQAQVWRLHPSARVTAISQYQWSQFPDLHPCAIIPHGVAVEQFTFREKPEDYVVYLGRFIPNKGPLDAIDVAQALECRLLLAGPRSKYYDEEVAPHVDGRRVVYVGEVNRAQRSDLLGRARALIYPLREPEPFGLVQVESMLCGTPVVAPRIGAVPEVVEDGLTGFTTPASQDVQALVSAARRAFELDRQIIRKTAERRFSAAWMAEDYLRLYEATVRVANPAC